MLLFFLDLGGDGMKICSSGTFFYQPPCERISITRTNLADNVGNMYGKGLTW